MVVQFGETLSSLRKKAQFSNRELAEEAQVPRSFIAGVQAGSRKIGEIQALKLADALGLDQAAQRDFVLEAVNTCSEKVLKASQEYPATLINMLPLFLGESGIKAQDVTSCRIESTAEGMRVRIQMNNGSAFMLSPQLTPAT